MPKITCPSCGNRGGTEIGSSAFETRGQWEGKPVRKCLECGAGMTVGLGLRGTKAKLIDSSTWGHMEQVWGTEFGSESSSESGSEEPAASVHFHVYEYASGGHPRRTVGIFSERPEAEDYAREYLADWEHVEITGDAATGFAFTSEESNYQADLGALRIEECAETGCESDI
jgi:hypothetical protein